MTAYPVMAPARGGYALAKLAVKRAGEALGGGDYARFRERYRHDPEGFARDCIDWRDDALTDYQAGILRNMIEYRREAARGPHGNGKTTTEALAVHWFALTSDLDTDWKIPTTASVDRQLTHYLWPEIHKWAHRIKWPMVGRPPYREGVELQVFGIKLETGEAFKAATKNPAFIEGAHASRMLYIFDEAKAIPDPIWDAAEGAFSTPGELYQLAVSTPDEPSGRFYQIHKRAPGYEDWHATHITLDEAIAAGRIAPAWAEQRRRQWGEASPIYRKRVLGEFASDEANTVIPLSWVELRMDMWREWQEWLSTLPDEEADRAIGRLVCLGADVAGEGNALTVFSPRFQHNKIGALQVFRHAGLMATAGRIVTFIKRESENMQPGESKPYAMIDAIGLGAGTLDRCREEGIDARAFIAGAKTNKRDESGDLGFLNVRAAAWWGTREMMHPESDSGLAIPPDDRLAGELTAPTWWPTSTGQIQVEPKETIIQRLKHSTDYADALVQSLWRGGPVMRSF